MARVQPVSDCLEQVHAVIVCQPKQFAFSRVSRTRKTAFGGPASQREAFLVRGGRRDRDQRDDLRAHLGRLVRQTRVCIHGWRRADRHHESFSRESLIRLGRWPGENGREHF
jgi:hypothetical protein